MVNNDDLFEPFLKLGSFEKVKFVSDIFRVSNPLELEFYSTVIDGILHYHKEEALSKLKETANDDKALTNLIVNEYFDSNFRSKLISTISLLDKSKFQSANIICKFLRENYDKFKYLLQKNPQVYEEVMLIYQLAYEHPAFNFNHCQEIFDYLNEIRTLNYIEHIPVITKKNESIQNITAKNAFRNSEFKYIYNIEVIWSSGSKSIIEKTLEDIYMFYSHIYDLFRTEMKNGEICGLTMALMDDVDLSCKLVDKFFCQFIESPKHILNSDFVRRFFSHSSKNLNPNALMLNYTFVNSNLAGGNCYYKQFDELDFATQPILYQKQLQQPMKSDEILSTVTADSSHFYDEVEDEGHINRCSTGNNKAATVSVGSIVSKQQPTAADEENDEGEDLEEELEEIQSLSSDLTSRSNYDETKEDDDEEYQAVDEEEEDDNDNDKRNHNKLNGGIGSSSLTNIMRLRGGNFGSTLTKKSSSSSSCNNSYIKQITTQTDAKRDTTSTTGGGGGNNDGNCAPEITKITVCPPSNSHYTGKKKTTITTPINRQLVLSSGSSPPNTPSEESESSIVNDSRAIGSVDAINGSSNGSASHNNIATCLTITNGISSRNLLLSRHLSLVNGDDHQNTSTSSSSESNQFVQQDRRQTVSSNSDIPGDYDEHNSKNIRTENWLSQSTCTITPTTPDNNCLDNNSPLYRFLHRHRLHKYHERLSQYASNLHLLDQLTESDFKRLGLAEGAAKKIYSLLHQHSCRHSPEWLSSCYSQSNSSLSSCSEYSSSTHQHQSLQSDSSSYSSHKNKNQTSCNN